MIRKTDEQLTNLQRCANASLSGTNAVACSNEVIVELLLKILDKMEEKK
jgi:hypothetical protein